jgi:hypothetical protein
MKRSYLLGGVFILAALVATGYASGRVWSEVKDNVAYVHHDDAFFNCCPEMRFLKKVHEDTTLIDIFEYDIDPKCNCMCYYNFTHTFRGLVPGTYVARVWEGDPDGQVFFAGRTTFTIYAQLGSSQTKTSMSDCHMEPEGVEESKEDDGGISLLKISNPAVKSVEIRYNLPAVTEVKLAIYDVTGARIRTLDIGTQEPGEHLVVWDTRDNTSQPVPRGIYFVRLIAGNQAQTLPVIVVH